MKKIEQAIDYLLTRTDDINRYFTTIEQVANCSQRDYQRNYNRFYRVRRGETWQSVYYGILEREQGGNPTFEKVITEIYDRTGNIEPSFSSKLVATLDPNMPVWDRYVLINLGKKLTGTSKTVRLKNAIAIYQDMVEWYQNFLLTDEAKQWIETFDKALSEYNRLTPTKKIDLILWSMRET